MILLKNETMRDNFVGCVNSIMGSKFVECQRVITFIGLAFVANRRHGQQRA